MGMGNGTQGHLPSSRSSGDSEKVVAFFGGIKEEFHKMAWTSKENLQAYTKVVVISTFVFGFAIYLMDLGVRGFLHGLEGLARTLGG